MHGSNGKQRATPAEPPQPAAPGRGGHTDPCWRPAARAPGARGSEYHNEKAHGGGAPPGRRGCVVAASRSLSVPVTVVKCGRRWCRMIALVCDG